LLIDFDAAKLQHSDIEVKPQLGTHLGSCPANQPVLSQKPTCFISETNLFYLRNQPVLLRNFTYFPQQNNSFSPENQLIFRPFSFAE
jgi:hypothetical protein